MVKTAQRATKVTLTDSADEGSGWRSDSGGQTSNAVDAMAEASGQCRALMKASSQRMPGRESSRRDEMKGEADGFGGRRSCRRVEAAVQCAVVNHPTVVSS